MTVPDVAPLLEGEPPHDQVVFATRLQRYWPDLLTGLAGAYPDACAGDGLPAGRDRRPELPRAAHRPAAARPAPARRPALVPAPADARLRHLRRHVRRHPEGRRGPGRLPGRAGGHLPAPDAAAQAPAGAERRRVRGDGLPRGPRGPGHHRGPARPGHHAAVPRHLADPGPGAQPRRRRAPVGGQRPGRRPVLPRLLLPVRRPRAAGRVRALAARGVPGLRARQLHLRRGVGLLGLDHLQQLAVGPQLAQPGGVLRVRRPDPVAGQPRRGVPAAGRDRVHLQADGHQLPEPARGARDHPGPAGGGPDRRPRADLQGRGDRRAGRPRPLPRASASTPARSATWRTRTR